MTNLPSGTVTFLFTDISGSTRLLETLGADHYGQLLSEHHAIVRRALEQFNGTEIDTQGDAFFASFPRASEAVAAVVQIQQALAEHNWPEGAEVRVRMGLHTGEPWLIEEGYVGMDVHRAARIAHVGHGSQVLLSETTTPLVSGELPDGVSLLDLGRHRLKDMRKPEHIHQLVIEGLPADFPPLASLELVVPPGVTGAEGEIRAPREVGESPYRGLAAFREDDAAFFFGRENFTEQLLDTVQARRLVAVVVGPSGSGKSSTVFAGLLPRLREEGGWLILQVRPGREPFHALAGAMLPFLEEDLSKTDRLVETQKLAQALRSGDLSLMQVIEPVLDEHADYSRLLLVIDQFEELYTLVPDPENRDAFHDELLAAVAAGSQGRESVFSLLLTLRADFMGQALGHRPFADALQEGSILLGPMNREELQAAIEKPAGLQGAAFETGLVDRLLDDVGQEPGNLPLLEFALTLLWDQMEQGWLTHAAYEAIGRVEGSLARYADEVYAGLSSEEKGVARRAFVQLVQPGEGTEDTRRVARRDELVGVGWGLVQHLADERLVVTGVDGSGEETVEVVHEALIRSWGQLRGWMDEDRDFRRWQEGLRAAVRAWEDSNQDDGALLRGAPLAQALEWVDSRSEGISETEKSYIEASAEFQAKRQHVRDRRRRLILGGLAVGLLAAVLLSVVALNQSVQSDRNAKLADSNAATATSAQGQALDQAATAEGEALERATQQARAEEEAAARATQQIIAEDAQAVAENVTRLALSRNLAVDAQNNLARNPQLALLLALQAVEQTYSVDQTVLPGVPDALHQAIQANSRHLLTIPAREGRVPFVSYSQGGTRLAVYQLSEGQDPRSFPEDTRVSIWDALTGDLLHELPEGIVADQWQVSDHVPLVELPGARSLKLTIWNIRPVDVALEVELQIPYETRREDIVALVLSSDLRKFALSHKNGHTIVWDMEGGRVLGDFYRPFFVSGDQPVGGEAPFQTTLTSHVAFHPDSNSIITQHQCLKQQENCSGLVILRIWDLDQVDGDPRVTWFSEGVELTLSPDGRFWGDAWTSRAETFDFESPEDVNLIFDHPQETNISTLTFSQDANLLGTSNSDRIIRVWDLEASRATDGEVLLISLSIPDENIHQMSFSPDGLRLATASRKGKVDIWDIQEAGGVAWQSFTNSLPLERESRVSIALSPDGRRLAVANADLTPRIWDTETGELLLRLPAHEKIVEHIAYSPKGDLIATCTHAGPMILWDAETGEEMARLEDFNEGACSMDFSVDGSSIALGIFKNNSGWFQVLILPDLEAPGVEELKLTIPLKGASTIGPINITFNPTGERVAMTYQRNFRGRFRVWETADNFIAETFAPPPGFIYLNVTYSPDGERLAATRPNGVTEIWDATGEDLQISFEGHQGPVNAAAFSPDGLWLATAGSDGMTKVWNANTGEEQMTLYGHNGPVTDVAFSPDGKKLYTASLDGTVRVYLMDIQELLALGESKLTRTLTSAECRTYLHLEVCP